MIKALSLGFAVLSLIGCGGGQSAPVAEPEPPDACEVEPTLASSARPKPTEMGCGDADLYETRSGECQGGDADACYQVGVCIKMQMLGHDADMAAEEWEQHFQAALDTMRRSCDSGIANACLFRAGVIQEELTLHPTRADATSLKKQLCEDSLQTCRLGNADGCRNCSMNECQDALE